MNHAFSVYVSDETSRCVPSGDAQARSRCLDEGMAFLADAATRIEGWALAAARGLIPDDYDDRMLPVACFEKRVLYRSVSPEELADVMETGAVTGGGNRFNDFEQRPFVFFSPEPSPACIAQGEEVERAASALAVRALDRETLEGPDGRTRFLELYRPTLARLKEERHSAPFTSAVLRTRPVGPSLHYSTEHGRTGMNGEDEYGLFPGQVGLGDIEEISLVKDGCIIDRLPPDAFMELFGPDAALTATLR